MRNLSTLLIAIVFLSFTASESFAVSFSDRKEISKTAQSFQFDFLNLPNNAYGGHFDITLNGDYSQNFLTTETATISLDTAVGSLVLNNSLSGILNNSIKGLLKVSYSRTLDYYDSELNYSFFLTKQLLSDILSDGEIHLTVTNGSRVSVYEYTDPDFINVGFRYAAVPLPAALPLLAAGFGLMFGLGRTRKKLTAEI